MHQSAALCGDGSKVAKMMGFDLSLGEKHCGKGENAGFQQFLLFPQCFQNAFYFGSVEQPGNCKYFSLVSRLKMMLNLSGTLVSKFN